MADVKLDMAVAGVGGGLGDTKVRTFESVPADLLARQREAELAKQAVAAEIEKQGYRTAEQKKRAKAAGEACARIKAEMVLAELTARADAAKAELAKMEGLS